MTDISVNVFAPTKPHAKQREVLKALDDGYRFVLLRAGRKFRKTSLMISWLIETALKTGLTCPYVAPNRVQAKNIVWDDHIPRILTEFKKKGLPYKTNEVELSVEFPRGKIQLLGVENKEALRGISNWGGICCFVGDTQIKTADGYSLIKNIKVGDMVATPTGLRKVLRSGEVKKVKQLLEVSISTGETIVCTPDHDIFTNNGVVPADELNYNTTVWTHKYHKQLTSKELRLGYKYAIKSIGTTAHGLEEKNNISIMQYGKKRMEQYLKDISFTTKTAISSIIHWKTLFVSVGLNTPAIILNTGIEKTHYDCDYLQKEIQQNSLNILGVKRESKTQDGLLNSRYKPQGNGTAQMKARNGTQVKEKEYGIIGSTPKRNVLNVVNNIWQHILKGLNTAPHVVGIRSLSYKEEQPVYDLTVEKDHCYFANGILVGNCDEYDDWQEDIYPTIIRPNLITNKAPVIIGGTPKGYRNIKRLEDGGIFKSFHFTSMDNPELDVAELESLIKEYKEMGESYYRQEILAEYERPAGAVYSDWDIKQRYVPFEYDPNLPVHLSWDFGINDPTSIIFMQPNGSEIRIFDYYEASNPNIEHYVQYMNSLPYKIPALETGDIAGKARELVSGKSPITELARLGHHIKTASIPNIPTQIRNTHRYIPRIYVSKSNPRCERIIECFMNYRYPEKRQSLINQENEIPIHDEYSHAMRALEYYCWNVVDASTKLHKEPPQISFAAHLERKRKERLLRGEYVGY